jgi:hypothetical protein
MWEGVSIPCTCRCSMTLAERLLGRRRFVPNLTEEPLCLSLERVAVSCGT